MPVGFFAVMVLVLALALASAPAAGEAAPAPIAPPQLLRAADVAYAELRRIADLTGPDSALEKVRLRLSRVERDLDQLRSAGFTGAPGNAATVDLDYFHDELARRDAEVRRWDERLSERSAQLDAAGSSLRRLTETWRLTLESLGPDAPRALAARAVEVRARSSALEQVVRKRLASILELQDHVLALKLRLADLLANLRSARTQGLLEIESTPLWRAFGRDQPAVWAFTPRAFELHALTCIRYVQLEPVRCALHVALVALLLGTALALRRRLADEAADGQAAIEVVSRHPVASATLLGLAGTPLLHPDAPPALSLLLFLAGVVPFLRVASALEPGWKRPLRWLAMLYAAERIAALAPGVGPFERVVLLAVEVTAIWGFANGLRRGGWLRVQVQGRFRIVLVGAATVAAALLGIAVVANVIGNVSLSEFLAGATLASACGTGIIATSVLVLGGAFRASLRWSRLSRSRLVTADQPLLVARAAPLFRAAAVVGSSWWTLRAFRSTQSFRAAATSTLGVRLKVGALDVTLGDVVAFAITLWLAVWISRALTFVLDRAVLPSLRMPRGRAAAISATVKYAIVAFGFSLAMLAAGMEMTRFTVLAGTLGVGIGFGLQNVVNNFVSGLILLYEQPVQVGDVIEIGQLTGEVQRIGVRSSTVRTFHGADVIVPNSNFISAEVVNWTRSDRMRRVDVAVAVAYGSEPQRVQELLLATARGFPGVAATPEPIALLTAFGDNALQFELRFWTAIDGWVATASGLRAAINDALQQAGIAIPFPQLDLWVRSLPREPSRAHAARDPGRVEPPAFPTR